MSSEHLIVRQVEFAETDMAGILSLPLPAIVLARLSIAPRSAWRQ